MIAWKSTLLFVSVLCSAFLSTKCSLGISDCNIDVVFNQVKSVLDSFGSPVTDLSYNDTLSLTKNLTTLYFNPVCQTPSFCYAYENFSHCEINDVYHKVEADILVVMKDIDSALRSGDDLELDQLLDFGDRIESIAKLSFQITYRYASSHTLLCTNLLLMRNLAVKLPGSNSTASERLTESLNGCTNRLNDDEFLMVDTLYHADVKFTFPEFHKHYIITVDYTSEDTFEYKCPTADIPDPVCLCRYIGSNERLLRLFPVQTTYPKIFNPGYCKVRETFSMFPTSSNVVGVQCNDMDLYIEQDFGSGQWFASDKPGEKVFGVYNEGTRVAIGIPLVKNGDSFYIDVEHRRLGRNSQVLCKNVTLITRCDIGVPEKTKTPCKQ